MSPSSINVFYSCILLSFVVCNCAIVKDKTLAVANYEQSPRDVVYQKDPSLDYCYKDIARQGQYHIFPNGTLYTGLFNRTLDSSSYLQYDDGTVVFCCTGEEASMIQHWEAAHFLLSSLFLQFGILLIVRPLVRINSSEIFRPMLFLLILLNIVLHGFTIFTPLDTDELWMLLPYALVFVTLVSITWLVLLSFDFTLMFLKLFAQRIYSNSVEIRHVNRAIRICLLLFSASVILVSYVDLSGILLSEPGYKAKAMEYLDYSLPYNKYIFTITCVTVMVCSVREVIFRKYSDAFTMDIAKINAEFLQLYFAIVCVCIFLAGMFVCKNWILWSVAMLLIIVTLLLGFREKDFSYEIQTFSPYMPIDD